jgi:protoporphyrinogen oxidase
MPEKIVIIGAGPTGLGAAYRLQEVGYGNWEIYERNSYIGGLAASFKDNKGFTWDIGGHVLFSRYDYVDRLIGKLLGDEYLVHQRDAWIWLLNCWVPYPFQNNIRHLPKDALFECLLELIKVQGTKDASRNLQEWILSTFGEGIAKYFMLPINSKSWAYPLESMDKNWIAGSISVIDVETVLRNIIYEQDERAWGPNSQFKFPLYGGTGGLFAKFMPYIENHLTLGEEVVEVDVDGKAVKFSSGRETSYDTLINTVPLDQFASMLTPQKGFLMEAATLLKHNGVFIVGVGIKKPCPSNKCWIYFPGDNCCFYRVTYFSNYSPTNVPNAQTNYSLMCETSYSEYKPEDKHEIIGKTIDSLVNARLINEPDKKLIETTYVIEAHYAYPIPTLERDEALGTIQPYLEENGILSRGRFGAWKYEVSSMDQSIMQGVEVVDRILEDRQENVFKSK